MLIGQITDCHVTELGVLAGDRVDTVTALRAAVDQLNSLRPAPAVVLATGDLVNDGLPGEYQRLLVELDRLDARVLPIPGNHDDRSLMRSSFPGLVPAGSPDDPIDYVVDDLAVRIVALDTTAPGRHSGALTPAQLEWLDALLAAAPDRPTLIAQHHPPFTTGIGWMDAPFGNADLYAELIAGHGNVHAIVCGHLHRSIATRFGSTLASTVPSTGLQLALALDGTPYECSTEPNAVAVHHWNEAEQRLTSHVWAVGTYGRWLPGWAQPLLAAGGPSAIDL